MTRRERLERKLDKREQWADSAKARAESRFNAADKICEHIPLGQPILVGHHSERHARADQNRIHSNMRAGCDELRKSEYHEQKAAGLERQLKTTIFSDDDNAIEALEAKIEKLTKLQELMKAANKLVKKHKASPDAAIPDLVKLGLDEARARTLFTPDFCGRLGFADYALINNNATIRQAKKRIEEIKVRQERQAKAEAAPDGILIEGEDYMRITFPEKPSRETLNELKAAGFRWSGGSWHGRRDQLPEGIES